MLVSIIIPTMNEEESIGEVIDIIKHNMNGVFDYEILIVDTNSKDKTVEIAKSKGAKVINEPRRGYGRAYKTGFENVAGNIIAALDGDLTYPAEDIPKLVKLLIEKNLDFITCDRVSRLGKGVMPGKHKIGNWILTRTANLLYGLKIKDTQSGMWIFRKNILDKIKLKSDGMALSEEIKIEAWKRGFKVLEVPIEYSVRKGGVKLSTWKDGYGNFKYLFKKRFGK